MEYLRAMASIHRKASCRGIEVHSSRPEARGKALAQRFTAVLSTMYVNLGSEPL